MNYELAKALKDAGFPQGQHHLSCYDHGCFEAVGQACVPTLSELISQFDETDFELNHNPGERWTACADMQRAEGDDPETATAKLWLTTR